MPITAPPGRAESTTHGGQLATRELRLAIVCFGGVSLAIYMHGATKELQSLFRASQAYAEDPGTNPWADTTDKTERAYWEALKEAQGHDEHRVATRVAIDIVSGTSAGGINGIVLAKALSRGASQDGLRDIWLDEGSLLKLANPFTGTSGNVFERVKGAASAMWKARRGPLSGDFLLRNVYDALEAMETPAGGDGDGDGDGESPWPIELHVTLTDVTGFPQAAPAWDPKVVRDVRHAYQLVFRRDPRRIDQFERDANRALAFAARATSSFPGAFPPTRIADLDALDAPWDGRAKFLEQYWAPYTLSETDATATEFMDGAVLDNAPFGLAIDAIDRQPATSQVDRKLLYIQPDPRDPEIPAHTSPTGILKAVWGGMSTIPRKEPIVRELLEVRRRNDRIHRANAVIEVAEAEAHRWEPPPASPDDLSSLDEELHEAMGADRAAAYAYRQLKLFTVVDRLAEIASLMLNYPPESGHALFVKDVLVAWARATELLEPEQWQAKQLPFLKDFDLSYRERRIRFVIDRINACYESDPGLEQRTGLDALKQALYGRVWELSALGEAARTSAEALALRTIFAEDEIRARLARDDDPQATVEQFAKDHRLDLDELRARLGSFLNDRLEHFTRDTYRLILDATDPWTDAPLRAEIRRRYAMFPRYDALLFPIRALSDLGELDPVEVVRLSPLDSRLLPVPRAKHSPPKVSDKLEGDAVGHFAAFLARPKRETDYLWGRLDAVERLISLLVGEQASAAYTLGFQAVVDAEAGSLTHIDELMDPLRKTVKELPARLAAQRIRAPAAS